MESDNKEAPKKSDEPSAPNQDNNEAESRFLYQPKGIAELPAILMPKFSRQNLKAKKEKEKEKPTAKKSQENANLKLKSSQEKVAVKLKSSNEKVELKGKKSSHEKMSDKPEEPQTPMMEESEKPSAEKPSSENPESAERLQQIQDQVKIDEGKKESPAVSTPTVPQPEDTVHEQKSMDPKSKAKPEKKEEKKKERLSKSIEDGADKGKKKGQKKKSPNKKSTEKKDKKEEKKKSELEKSAYQTPPELINKGASPPPKPAAPPRGTEKPEKSKPAAPPKGFLVPTKKASKRSHQQQKDKNKKTLGFLKAVYAKTKFWARKSDCVAEPTKEMLAKAYVVAEYDPNNKDEFNPPLKGVLTEQELKTRMKNAGSGNKDVFLHNRPFWLTRLQTDTFPPKCKIQMHRQLKQTYQGNASAVLPKMPKRQAFFDPLSDPLDNMVALDKHYGTELVDVQKRVVSNTFHATLMFETDKLEAEKNKKWKVMEREQKSASSSESTPRKTTFRSSAGAPIGTLYTYDRKQRPSKHPVSGKKKRPFTARKFTHTERKGAAKKTMSNSSNSNSVHQDVKK